jgi:hypothetical protein
MEKRNGRTSGVIDHIYVTEKIFCLWSLAILNSQTECSKILNMRGGITELLAISAKK